MKKIFLIAIILFAFKFGVAEECRYCIPENSNISCQEVENTIKLVNKIRAEVGTAPLKWDCKLAEDSQRWAEYLASKETLAHSQTNGKYGENLYFFWSSNGDIASLEDAIKSWYAEKKYFIYGSPNWCKAGKVCGHYTQLVWKDTKAIGCGKAYKNNATYVVCRFYPAGNWLGKQPY